MKRSDTKMLQGNQEHFVSVHQEKKNMYGLKNRKAKKLWVEKSIKIIMNT